MADETNIPTGVEAIDVSKRDAPLAHDSTTSIEPATPMIAGSFVMPKEPPLLALITTTPPPPAPQITPEITPLIISQVTPQAVPQNIPKTIPQVIAPITRDVTPIVTTSVAPIEVPPAPRHVSPAVTPVIQPSVTPVIPLAVLQAVAPPPLKAVIPEDETEYERIERFKLNTDDAPHSGAINEDIAKILKEVKLPERRDFKGAADTKMQPPTPIPPIKTPAEKPPAPNTKDSDAPKERSIVTALHTLKDDVQDVVRNRNMSLVRASALEQDKKRGELPKSIPNPAVMQRRRRTFAIIFFALLLTVLGSAALYGVAVVMQQRATTPPPRYPSLVFAESVVTLPIDTASPDSLKATIAQARTQSTAPAGSILRIIPTITTTDAKGVSATTPATLPQFFTALGLQVPSTLMQGLSSTFFFGIHAVDINAPVFVIQVTSYDHAFAGMLAWEPSMNQNLSPAFDAVPTLITGADGLPTSRAFTDAVMLNYDIRELKDNSGKVILYYSFPTPNILVIAESPSTFSEILSRLEAQREL
jgi:hypothetical protein